MMMDSLQPIAIATHPLILCVEGNIAVGKSSVLELLKDTFRLDPTVLFVDEPVSLWEQSGMLAGMYDGSLPKSTFQLAALMTRAGALLRALAVPGARVVVCERSPFSDKMVFSETNLKENSVERRAYDAAYAELIACLPTHADVHFAYLDAEVEVVVERMQRRNRSSEVNSVLHEYLRVLKAAHEKMFMQFVHGSVTAIDASRSRHDVTQCVAHLIMNGINRRPYVHPAMLNSRLVQTWGPMHSNATLEWPKPAESRVIRPPPYPPPHATIA